MRPIMKKQLDDCGYSSGLRDRFRDGSARLDGPQTAPSSTNRGLNESANGRVAEQGGKGSDGHLTGGYLLMEGVRGVLYSPRVMDTQMDT